MAAAASTLGNRRSGLGDAMLERTFANSLISTKAVKRNQQIEYLRSEAQRLRAALAVRERKIVRLEAELQQLKETTS